ncbi:alpha/beta fold hydrolase [Brevibacillus agri]|uniref:alpha/beta fold hydrolase n=1 Tax=Brevibacillus agri TaxID=51101 RepID=UPI0018CCE537|nr:alpha/beta hydrolase [Brevibacillus agri]MBG9565409.1 alpha/beta hydrolase [Brevibacillus agri]
MEPTIVQLDSHRIACHLSGRGTPRVCIHAPCIGSVNFDYQEPLADVCQLVVPDLPGHGDSSPLAGPTTMRELASVIHGLCQSLGLERPLLLGYSQGASLVLEYCLRFPENARGAILVSAFSEVTDFSLHSRFLLAQSLSCLHAAPLIARSIAASHLDDPLARSRWIEHGSQTDAASLRHLYAAGHRYNCTDQLSQLKLPMLLVYGADDANMLPYARLLEKKLPQAELVMVPSVKHQVVTRAAATFNQLCRQWLN